MIIAPKKCATAIISIIALTGAIVLLNKQLQGVTLASVHHAVQAISVYKLLTSLLLTFSSFTCLAFNESLAVKVGVKKKVSLRTSLFTGASANAIANTLGFHAVTGGAWRYRIYSAIGLTLGDLARIISIASAGIGLSFVTVTALALITDKESLPLYHFAGMVLLLILASTLYYTRNASRNLTCLKLSLTLPGTGISLQLIAIGIIEMGCAVGALYVLLPPHVAPEFAHFILFYIGAILLGIMTGTPGGLGVFELTLMSALCLQGQPAIIAALLVYRIIYNLLPFAVTCLGIIFFETRKRINLKEDNFVSAFVDESGDLPNP